MQRSLPRAELWHASYLAAPHKPYRMQKQLNQERTILLEATSESKSARRNVWMSAQRREDLHALCALDEDTTSSTASANTAAPDADTIVADDVAKTANADAQLRPASSSGSADPLGSCGALSAPSVCNVRLAVTKQRPLMLSPAEKRTAVC